MSLILTALVFVVWDILAVSRGHWSFGLEHTLNWMIVNQPIEEIMFFFVIPFFGLVVYRFVSKGENP
jgi:lycopene cyclase domain-containing protein